jgi:hypothetical protein
MDREQTGRFEVRIDVAVEESGFKKGNKWMGIALL